PTRPDRTHPRPRQASRRIGRSPRKPPTSWGSRERTISGVVKRSCTTAVNLYPRVDAAEDDLQAWLQQIPPFTAARAPPPPPHRSSLLTLSHSTRPARRKTRLPWWTAIPLRRRMAEWSAG